MSKLNFMFDQNKKFARKKLIIFDLDGVLVDSITNMKKSWNLTREKFSLKPSFYKYKHHIGIPFNDILKSLKIKKKLHKNINFEFKKNSLKYIDSIKFYPNTLSVLKYLSKKYKLGVFTSKERSRTLKILKKLKINFDIVQCPIKRYRGKPYPDLMNKIIKDMKLKKNETVYIGDTKFDYLCCRSAGVDFILAKYGYRIGIKKYKYQINKLNDLKKVF